MTQEHKPSAIQQHYQQLLVLPLGKLEQIFATSEEKRIDEQREERTPEEQNIASVWFLKSRAKITKENREELEKKKRGEPHEFDEYAPY